VVVCLEEVSHALRQVVARLKEVSDA